MYDHFGIEKWTKSLVCKLLYITAHQVNFRYASQLKQKGVMLVSNCARFHVFSRLCTNISQYQSTKPHIHTQNLDAKNTFTN